MSSQLERHKFIHQGVLSPLKRWGIKWSLWPVHLVTACCGVELAHTYACGFDAERLGSLYFGMCRQANAIIIEGAVTRKMARILKMTYEQMPDPKFVIAMGSCAIEGGVFWNSYHIVRPWEVVPVDVFISGCPPTPDAVLRAIRIAQDYIERGVQKDSYAPKKVDLEKVIEKPAAMKPQRAPAPPVRVAPKPKIVIEVEKKVDWPFGYELVERLKRELSGLYSSIVVSDVNRICIRTTVENVVRVAEKLRSLVFDHVKSVNVIDVIAEKKFVIQYVISSYSVKEYMSVLVSVVYEVPREDGVKVPSLSSIYPSCDYLEREMHEMFGIWFEGNAWMGRTFLLDPDLKGKHPLRKDFKIEAPAYVITG